MKQPMAAHLARLGVDDWDGELLRAVALVDGHDLCGLGDLGHLPALPHHHVRHTLVHQTV